MQGGEWKKRDGGGVVVVVGGGGAVFSILYVLIDLQMSYVTQ